MMLAYIRSHTFNIYCYMGAEGLDSLLFAADFPTDVMEEGDLIRGGSVS